MIGRLNHVAIAVSDIAKAAERLSRHARRRDIGRGAAARPRRDHRVHHSAQHQDRTARAARRRTRRSRNSSSAIRTAASITSATRSTTSSPRATGSRRRARACSATASRRSARMASRCCSCIPRISAARWSRSSRRERCRSPPPFAIYFVIWWIVLFAVLPWGVRSQHESGDSAPGTDPGAPAMPGSRASWSGPPRLDRGLRRLVPWSMSTADHASTSLAGCSACRAPEPP